MPSFIDKARSKLHRKRSSQSPAAPTPNLNKSMIDTSSGLESSRSRGSASVPGSEESYQQTAAVKPMPNKGKESTWPRLSRLSSTQTVPITPNYAALFTRECFQRVLDNPVGAHKLGKFLTQELAAEQLTFWLNATQIADDFANIQDLTQRIYRMYIPEEAPLALNITDVERQDIATRYKALVAMEDPYAAARGNAFETMFLDAWPRFINHRLGLAQNVTMIQEKHSLMSFCLVNASVKQEILMVSQGFLDLCGYPLDSAIDNNCRFLQGTGTSRSTVQRIKDACAAGIPCQELLLNYKQAGKARVPVWVLLRIEPLRDGEGQLRFFLGHQFCMNANAADVGFLLSDDLDAFSTDPDNALAKVHEHELARAQERKTIRPIPMDSQVFDRDQRLRDASAIASGAVARRPTSSRPASMGPGFTSIASGSGPIASGSSPIASGSGPIASDPIPSTGSILARSSIGNRGATSAGRIAAFGGSKNGDTTEGIESEADKQTQSLKRFLLVGVDRGGIMFSSPSLPAEFAQNRNFFDIVTKTNSRTTMQRISKVMQQNGTSVVEANLVLEPGSRPTRCELNISTLINGHGRIRCAVVLFITH